MSSQAALENALHTNASAPDPRERLAVALDFPSAAAALELVDRLDGSCRWFKVGLELFCASGPGLIHQLRDCGFEVFLDLKLHDIPNTVAGAVRSVIGTGASLLTVHAAGGRRMLEAAAAAAATPDAPRLLAVTVLTSMDVEDLQELGVGNGLTEQVLHLAMLAESSGISGMVCSPREIALLRTKLDRKSLLVIPGIRPTAASIGDQRRVATPAAAIQDGASMLVVGRPITQADDPGAAARSILAEISEALLRRAE